MRRLVLALLLLAGAMRADALDFTGLWYNPTQPGYGFNFAQSDDYLFGTFFIYGQNGAPSWYIASLTADGNGSYTGELSGTLGTWFTLPWVPGNFIETVVGTATFTPSTANAYEATLTLAVAGIAPVVFAVQRQTLTPIALGGAYNGGQSGAYSGCTVPGNNYAYLARYDLQVTHLASGAAMLQFKYTDGLVCTLQGTLVAHGSLYSIDNAAYACSDGTDTTAQVSELKATSLGIEGRYLAPSVGGGCAESASFAAVLN